MKKPYAAFFLLCVSWLASIDTAAAGITSPLLEAAGQTDVSFLTMEVDAAGNIYYSTSHDTTNGTILDLDPGPGVTELALPASQRICLVAKVDPELNLEWLRVLQIPDGLVSFGRPHADANGNVYVALRVAADQTIDFGEPGSPFLIASGDVQTTLIWKMDADGTTQWVVVFDTDFSVSEIRTGPGGSVHLLGSFTFDSDFDPGSGIYELSTFTALYGAYKPNAVVVKLNSAGQFAWARHFAETDRSPGSSGHSMVIGSDGSVFVATSFTRQVDADPGAGVQRLFTNPVGDTDTLIVRLNTSGNLVWATQYAQNGLRALQRDNSGGLLMLHFRDYITRFLQTGTFQWVRAIDTLSSSVNVNDLVAGDDGDFYLAGAYQDLGDIGTGPGDMANFPVTPTENGSWVARWDLGGTQLWCARLPSVDSRAYSLFETEVYFADNHVVLVENFTNPVDVNPSANAQQILTPYVSFDGYDTAFIKLRSSNGLWLDFDTTTAREMDGSLAFPLRTLANALRTIQSGQDINILSAGAGVVSPETGIFSKPATIRAVGATARIGVTAQ